MRILASAAAASIGGRLVGPDVEFDGASFDSRLVRPGQLFIPIVADRNGHEYIETAISAGAAAYLTSQPEHAAEAGTSIEVDDTAVALMALAAWARSQSVGKVIGVTGSVGKTSTKDLIAAACASGLRTAANERSFNNEQGLPITVLNAPDDTEVLVLEMGMRGFGEITRLCDVAQPDIGVVTAVGHSHTERVGGIEGVAKAKKELVEALDASGTAILNADDERVLAMARHAHATVLTYGTSADVRLSGLELDALARPRFQARDAGLVRGLPRHDLGGQNAVGEQLDDWARHGPGVSHGLMVPRGLGAGHGVAGAQMSAWCPDTLPESMTMSRAASLPALNSQGPSPCSESGVMSGSWPGVRVAKNSATRC